MPQTLVVPRSRTADSSYRRPIKRRVEALHRSKTITVGPQDHGRRMSLAVFAEAEGQPGYNYELERGVIVVTNVPRVNHFLVVQAIRDRLSGWRLANPDRSFAITGGGEGVMRLPEMESERHPDLSIYMTAPPGPGEPSWDEMTPDIAIEVVSKGSIKRDYVTKRADYLAAGVRAYWIIDPIKFTATVLNRRGDTWHETKLGRRGTIRTPLLLGFALKLAGVFAAMKLA